MEEEREGGEGGRKGSFGKVVNKVTLRVFSLSLSLSLSLSHSLSLSLPVYCFVSTPFCHKKTLHIFFSRLPLATVCLRGGGVDWEEPVHFPVDL